MTRSPLNPRQVEVLRWIADGCPDGLMADFTYKTTSYALRNRHLVTVSKKGGWQAAITESGRFYLEHGHYPDRVELARAVRKTRQRASGSDQNGRVAPKLRPMAAEAAGALVTPEESAKRVRIPIRARLGHPHPAVAALRDAKDDYRITKSASARALLIAQALAEAAEQEGYLARLPSADEPRRFRAPSYEHRARLEIDTGECVIGVVLVQENDREVHIPTKYEAVQKARNAWIQIPEWDYIPSQRLRLELDSRFGFGRRGKWADRKRWALEDKLHEALEEVRERHEEATRDRLNREQREAERQREWRAAMDAATFELRESHRSEVLSRHEAAWSKARRLREYLAAMETAIAQIADSRKESAAREWLEWAKVATERMDPLNRPIRMPDDPEATPEALKPFLKGLSAYGPRGW